MAINNNKKSNFEIVVVDDELKSLGFVRVSIINKNIIVSFADGNRPAILSRFKIDDLAGTLKSLQKKLTDNGIDKEASERLDVFLTETLIQKINESMVQKEETASSIDVQKILKEIEKDKNTIGQISVEQWQAGILERYQNLQKKVEEKLPNLWQALEFVLSVKTILNIKDCTLPFAGILLGPPSSLKTVGVELFRKWPQTYYTDNFSAKSFVSHSTAVTKEQLEEIDMLPKIKNKLFLTPELAPTFAAKDDDLIQILGIMTRILDGHGYESDTGAQGHRGYNEKMMFTWVGAAVDIPYKVHRYLGTLGPKLYFFRLPKVKKTEDEYLKDLNFNFEQNIQEIREALFRYLKWFEIGPNIVNENDDTGLPKIEWDPNKDDELAKRYIVRLAGLLAHLRGVVPTWHTQDTQGSNYGYGLAIKEECDRAIKQLYNLARGRALSLGRNYIIVDDIPLVVKVVLSTASIERVTMFDLLLAYRGKMTTSQIATSLNVSSHTAHRTMTELKALSLVDMKKEEAINAEYEITLDAKFNWFLSKEFLVLRGGFVPSDNSEYLKNQRKIVNNELEEKIPSGSQQKDNSPDSTSVAKEEQKQKELEEKLPSITDKNLNSILPMNSKDNNLVDDQSNEKSSAVEGNFSSCCNNYEKESIFFSVFEELSKENGDGLVDYEKLRSRLISTGKFFAGDAFMIIEHMVKTGQIEQTSFHLYSRKKASDTGVGSNL